MTTLLEIKNINKTIQNKTILKNLSFKLLKGHITALLGPNGSGKTTTLKILSKLIGYDSGILEFDDSLNHINKKVMLVFDEPILYEELTGIEHLNFNMELYNIKLTETEKKEYMQMFQLEQYMHDEIYTYSLGTRKKLQLLCTLINNPPILLLDEYISGLDPISLYNIKNILKQYALKGNSILLATHMLDVAEKFCDDAIIISNGSIVNNDLLSIHDIKEKYSSLEDYFLKSL